MSAIDTSDKQRVVSVAEGGIPVTGAMIDEWCAAYDRSELPDGYETEGAAMHGRPPLHGEAIIDLSFECSRSEGDLISRAATAAGMGKSEFVRSVVIEKARTVLAGAGGLESSV